MASVNDLWFIRLPDGRTLRARNTEALRRYLKTGRIPWESRVRQSADAAWQTLDRTPEFANLVPADRAGEEEAAVSEAPVSNQTRSSGAELRTLGVRGLIDELYNAVDNSLQRTKLIAAAITGLSIGVVLVLADVAIPLLPRDWTWIGYLGGAFIILVLFNICTSILTQMTALELSRLRPAQFSEVRAHFFTYIVRLTCALSLVGGSILGVIFLLRMLTAWLSPGDAGQPGLGLETLLNVVQGTRRLLEVVCWPILGFALLLMGPIFIVEDHSIAQGLREWINMLRQHLGRIYLYQAIAFAIAAVMTLPLILPVLLAFGLARGTPQSLSLGESISFYLLFGVALTPMLAYLLVAHVFIYLNLRYEFFYSARER